MPSVSVINTFFSNECIFIVTKTTIISIMYVRLSVRLPVCINAASSGRINKKLDIEDFMKVYRQIPNLVVNIGQNVGYFT